MPAYHNNPAIKERLLAQVRAHRAADEIAHGAYVARDPDGRMRYCAVGCTIHSEVHAAYESIFGCPEALAELQDSIFERLPAGPDLLFPERFLEAIPVGADLSRVGYRFLLWLLMDPIQGVSRVADEPEATQYGHLAYALNQVIRTGKPRVPSCAFSPYSLGTYVADYLGARRLTALAAAAEDAVGYLEKAEGARGAYSSILRDQQAVAQAEELLRLLAAAPVAS